MSKLLYKETQLDLFEDTLPPETDEKGCDSFDDLVYVMPTEDTCVPYDILTVDQKEFLLNRLNFNTTNGHNEPNACHFSYCPSSDLWFTETEDIEEGEHIAIFNDIFIHKDDLEKQ